VVGEVADCMRVSVRACVCVAVSEIAGRQAGSEGSGSRRGSRRPGMVERTQDHFITPYISVLRTNYLVVQKARAIWHRRRSILPLAYQNGADKVVLGEAKLDP